MKFSATFGVLIAFLLPGFLCLYGLSLKVPALHHFVDVSAQTTNSADFLYTALASLSIGLIVSAIRWAVVDNLFGWLCGFKWPQTVKWDKLQSKNTLAAFQLIVQNHYHYYQYYSNTLVAILIVLFFNGVVAGRLGFWTWAFWGVVLIVLIVGSRDTLKRYYHRGTDILS